MSRSDFIQLLLSGLFTTVLLTLAATAVAAPTALLAGLARASAPFYIKLPVTTFVEIFRGTSCYVQLFAAFFILPMYGVNLSAFAAATIVLGFNIGSYGSEVVRGAIKAVPQGQVEAAISLNFTRFQRFRYVTLPNALILIVPAASNLLIDLLKLTPLASLITVTDLTYQAMVLRQQTGNTLIPFLIIFLAYFVLASAIASFSFWLERIVKKGSEGLGGGQTVSKLAGGSV